MAYPTSNYAGAKLVCRIEFQSPYWECILKCAIILARSKNFSSNGQWSLCDFHAKDQPPIGWTISWRVVLAICHITWRSHYNGKLHPFDLYLGIGLSINIAKGNNLSIMISNYVHFMPQTYIFCFYIDMISIKSWCWKCFGFLTNRISMENQYCF